MVERYADTYGIEERERFLVLVRACEEGLRQAIKRKREVKSIKNPNRSAHG